MEKIIDKALRESVKAKEDFVKENGRSLIFLAEKIAQSFTSDRKLLICGNGGSAADAQHIAIASVVRVDVLVSWNFQQIVNLNRIRAFNAVNLRLGYQILEIRSPREVVNEKDV